MTQSAERNDGRCQLLESVEVVRLPAHDLQDRQIVTLRNEDLEVHESSHPGQVTSVFVVPGQRGQERHADRDGKSCRFSRTLEGVLGRRVRLQQVDVGGGTPLGPKQPDGRATPYEHASGLGKLGVRGAKKTLDLVWHLRNVPAQRGPEAVRAHVDGPAPASHLSFRGNNPAVWTKRARPVPPPGPFLGPSWSTPERLASNPDGYVVTGASGASMYAPAPGAGWTNILTLVSFFGNESDGVATYANGQDRRIFIPVGPRGFLEATFNVDQAAWVVVGPVGDRVDLGFQGRPQMLDGLTLVASTWENGLYMLDRQNARDGWIQVGDAGTADYAPSQGVRQGDNGIAFLTDSGAPRKIRSREYEVIHSLVSPDRIRFTGNGWAVRASPVQEHVAEIRSRPAAVLNNLDQDGRRAFVVVLKRVPGL